MSRLVIGIDPGLSGAYAVVTADGNGFDVQPLPVIGAGNRREIDARTLADALLYLRTLSPIALAVVEEVAARPGQGVVSMFTFGRGVGTIHGVLSALRVPIEVVKPQVWQRAILPSLAPTVRKEDRKAALKQNAIAYATKRYPSLKLRATAKSKTDHDGMADAICLAEFGRRLLTGEAGYETHLAAPGTPPGGAVANSSTSRADRVAPV